MKVAATGDLHCRVGSGGAIRRLLEGVEEADVLLLTGDLTNFGLAEEMQVLLEELDHFALPKVAVPGNHDYESEQEELLVHMLRSGGVKVLDADVWEFEGVEFVGVKGFCGGFGRHRLQPFGEGLLKDFIGASIHEVVRLEEALEGMTSDRRVALLHYAPIPDTLEGEALEVYPFLGFSLFGDAFDRHGVDRIVHGHAHHGVPEGTTPGGIPVHNVSRYVLQHHFGRSYTVFEV
jgi:Icc-related predicted phosphoesterase